MSSLLKERLHQGELLVGTMLTLPYPEIAEIMKLAGFDWLFLDGEHAPFSTLDLQRVIQSAGEALPCLIRLAASEEIYIKKALDCGAKGVIAPMIKSSIEVEKVVRYAKYPPLGTRGVGLGRAQGYGLKFQDYVQAANQETIVVIQVEHIQAVENIHTITQVSGIDAVLIGPYDLSASMGRMGEVGHPDVVAAIRQVIETCQGCKIPLGIFSLSTDDLIAYRRQGFTLIVAGVDTLFMGEAAKNILKLIKA
jgi:2-dehydro-3-deoxyglucarate aldolase